MDLKKLTSIVLSIIMIISLFANTQTKEISAAEVGRDLGNYVIDISQGDFEINTLSMSNELKYNIESLLFSYVAAHNSDKSITTNDNEVIVDYNLDGKTDFYIDYTKYESDGIIVFKKTNNLSLTENTVIHTFKESEINSLKEEIGEETDYYSGIEIVVTKDLGALEIDLNTSSSFKLNAENQEEENIIVDALKKSVLNDDYIVYKYDGTQKTVYNLDFTDDGWGDVEVDIPKEYDGKIYYDVRAEYISSEIIDKEFVFNVKPTGKEGYSSVIFVFGNKKLNYDKSVINIDFSEDWPINEQSMVDISYLYKDAEAIFKNISYIEENYSDMVIYKEEYYIELDLDKDKKKDVEITFGKGGYWNCKDVSETIINTTISIDFPEDVKGFKKISFTFPKEIYKRDLGVNNIDFSDIYLYNYTDHSKNFVNSFLYEAERQNVITREYINIGIDDSSTFGAHKYDIDKDGTFDIANVISRYEGVYIPLKESNLLGKSYKVSLDMSNNDDYYGYSEMIFVFPKKEDKYIEVDLVVDNNIDQYTAQALYCFILNSDEIKYHKQEYIDLMDNDIYCYIDKIGYVDSEKYDILCTYYMKNGNVSEKGATILKSDDSSIDKNEYICKLKDNYSVYEGIKYIFRADINKADVSEVKDVIYEGKSVNPDIELSYKGKLLKEGKDYTLEYKNNNAVGKGTIVIKGAGNFYGSIEKTFDIVGKKSVVDGPKKGKTIKDKKYIYKVLKAGSTDGKIVGKLSVTGLKKKSLTTIKIAKFVKIGGVNYKVTTIGKNAFKNNKKIKKAIIGLNVTSIENGAFSGCKKLKQVSINSTKLKNIKKKAFAKDKKLKKIIIKSKKLKNVAKNAFKGVKKSCIIKVPVNKKKAYRKIFKNAKCKAKIK